jgi:hypothetical protein
VIEKFKNDGWNVLRIGLNPRPKSAVENRDASAVIPVAAVDVVRSARYSSEKLRAGCGTRTRRICDVKHVANCVQQIRKASNERSPAVADLKKLVDAYNFAQVELFAQVTRMFPEESVVRIKDNWAIVARRDPDEASVEKIPLEFENGNIWWKHVLDIRRSDDQSRWPAWVVRRKLAVEVEALRQVTESKSE